MRLTLFLLIAGCLTVNASGLAQVVSMSYKNTSLEQVCLAVQKQTGYFFLYDKDVLKKAGNVTVNIKNLELNDALKAITAGKPLTYKIIDKTVIISELKVQNNNLSQEEITVKGTVRYKNQSGTFESLPGVSVTLKGTRRAANTDVNGNYVIKVPSNATLIFNMVGFTVREIPVNGRTSIDVDLEESMTKLNEVIITGYGTSERKENQVGSAFQVTSKDLEMKPLDRVDRLLEGVVPGLEFNLQDNSTSSARPRFETRIRGEASFSAANDPLWVVDGVPLNTGDETNMILGVETSISPLTYLNPADIESIVVLKDATATSIYGANGSNGVILITTKKGKAGANRINYSFRGGISSVTDNRFKVLSYADYVMLYNEALANNPDSKEKPLQMVGEGTDWYDLYFQTGVNTNHDLSFSGGNEKNHYYVSGSYFKQKDIMIKNTTDRFSTRVNLDKTINKSLNLFFQIGASYNINNMFTPNDTYYTNRPTLSPYDPTGLYTIAFYNKLPDAEYNDNRQNAAALLGNIGGTLKFFPWLKYTTTNGVDFSSVSENRYTSERTFSGRSDAYAYKSQSNSFNWTSMHRVNFDKQYKKNDISLMLGGEAIERSRRSVGSTGWSFPNDDIREVTYAVNTEGRSSGNEQASLSYYGQLNYSFDRRYSLIASFRNDGNSDFGSDVKWASFRSAGVAWTISNEKFWKLKPINFAKLKFSYGTNGNSRIGAYVSKGIYDFSVDNNYNGESGAIMSKGENPILSWEKTYLLNTGLTLGFFENRISVEAEYYRNTTKDILDDVSVSWTSGTRRILQNVGSVRNSGIELTLNTKNISNETFEWSTNFNIAHNSNRVLELYNNNDRVLDTKIRRVGMDVNSWYLIRWAGVDPRDGAGMWYDTRGNLTRNYNAANRVVAGTATPDAFGGMTNTFSYKGISLRALVAYTVGGKEFSRLERETESDGAHLDEDNQSVNQLDRWREPGELAKSPKQVLDGTAQYTMNSTRFLHSKSNLRLQNISMSYVIPQKFANRIKLNNVSVYAQADNLGIWTPYRIADNRNSYANSFRAYPNPLTISFGLNAGF
ncbi:SusC/RagA family TonB-linked outer membrane protein [Desertivirga xinjiangensis]|uniref:SusC/RagA family TonB-linked outer membrane protein n=1 Tax=Desertivirga xinjiangensis TaxID=539206 RepID=UPI0021091B6C|nr:SusC/RagA family TonB-linked outer membrane protein [Pedobacter xinjiangensis]